MKIAPVLALVSGLALVVLAVVIFFLTPVVIWQKINSEIVIDSENHPNYASQFLTNDGENAPPRYNQLFFYNILNVQEVLNGSSPRYQELGPYTFREIYKRQDVAFSDDGNLVTFNQNTQNIFQPKLSNGTLHDQISIFNLPYIKVMSKFGYESKLLAAASTKVFTTALQELQAKMVPSIINGAVSKAIEKLFGYFRVFNGNYDGLWTKMGGDCSGGNSCKINSPPFLGKYTPILTTNFCNCVNCACAANKVPLDIMRKIFNSSDQYSITNSQQGNGTTFWLSGNYYDQINIQMHFGITPTQFSMFYNWLKNVSQSDIIKENVFSKLNARGVPNSMKITSWSDIPLRQFLRGDVLQLLLETKSPVSVQPSSPPEFYFYIQSLKTKPIGNVTFEEATNSTSSWTFQTLTCIDELLSSDPASTLFELKGLRSTRPGKIEDFTRPSLDIKATNLTWSSCTGNSDNLKKLLSSYSSYTMETILVGKFGQIISNNGGLIVNRTIKELALGKAEPILQIVLEPSDPRYNSFSILPNDKSLDGYPFCTTSADVENDYTSCRQIRSINSITKQVNKTYLRAESTFRTGKMNFGDIGQFQLLNGNSSFDGVFIGGNESISTKHFSAGESFQPLNHLLATKDDIQILLIPLTIPLTFQYNYFTNDLYGLKLMRYKVDPDQFSSRRFDAALYGMQNIKDGLLNVSDPKAVLSYVGLPSISNSLFNANSTIYLPTTSTTTRTDDDEEELGMFVDIDPITGKTLRANINVDVIIPLSKTQFDVYYPNMSNQTIDMVRVYRKRVKVQINEEQADKIKMLYIVSSLQIILFAAFLILGICLFATSTFCFLRNRHETKWNNNFKY